MSTHTGQGGATAAGARSSGQIRPAAFPVAEPAPPKNPAPSCAFLHPGAALRRVIARSRPMLGSAPGPVDPEDRPGWLEWYDDGFARNRALSLAGGKVGSKSG
jgi:hypothetical protein